MPDSYTQVQLPPLPSPFAGEPPGMTSMWDSDNALGSGGYGPWKYGGRFYALILTKYSQDFSYNLENFYFNVYRSDDGLTWYVLDPDNAPSYGQIGHFDQQASKIVVLCSVNTDWVPWQLYNFDLVSDTWGPAYALSPTGLPFDNLRDFCRTLTRANGHQCVIFNASFSGLLLLTEWDGTAWTTPVRVDYHSTTGSGAYYAAMLEPSSGNIHLLTENFGPDGEPIGHHVIHPDNTLGPQTMLWPRANDRYPMPMAFFQGKLYIFHYDPTETGTGTDVLGYFVGIGTPATEPTSFSDMPVTGPIPPAISAAACALVTPDGSTLHCLYGYNSQTNPGFVVLNSRQFYKASTTNGTSWASTLFFDLWPQFMGDYALSASYIGMGGCDGIGAFAQIGAIDPSNTYYMVKNAGGTGGALGNRIY